MAGFGFKYRLFYPVKTFDLLEVLIQANLTNTLLSLNYRKFHNLLFNLEQYFYYLDVFLCRDVRL